MKKIDSNDQALLKLYLPVSQTLRMLIEKPTLKTTSRVTMGELFLENRAIAGVRWRLPNAYLNFSNVDVLPTVVNVSVCQ
jgi:hypothetical protein